jgi:hypothetical protein
MSTHTKADDATLMQIYKEGLTHTLDAAVRAVYERGLHDGIEDATAHPQAQAPATSPAPPTAPSHSPAAHLTPPKSTK